MNNPQKMRLAHHAINPNSPFPTVDNLNKFEWQEKLTAAQKSVMRTLRASHTSIAFLRASPSATKIGYFPKGGRRILPETANILIKLGICTEIWPNHSAAIVLTPRGRDIADLLSGRLK